MYDDLLKSFSSQRRSIKIYKVTLFFCATMTSEWLRINVDETDAQRRKRIEQELNSLFHAEVIPIPTPPKKASVTGESSWRRLFGASPQPKISPPSSAPDNQTEGDFYFARPTLGDVVVSGSKLPSAQPTKIHTMPRVGTTSDLNTTSSMAVAKLVNSQNKGAATADWRQLPPCPLQGYTLTDKGLIDLEAVPHSQPAQAPSSWWPWNGSSRQNVASSSNSPEGMVVNADELMSLAAESTRFRTATKILDDGRYFQRQHDRATNGMGRVMPWMMGICGSAFYFNVYRCFSSIPARNSLFFKYVWTQEKGYTQNELQRMAQRFRVPMVLSTTGVMSQLFVGSCLLGCAIKFRLPSDLDKISPVGQQTKLLDEQEAKSHALARYLWFVYYHHPAYEEHRTAREAAKVQGQHKLNTQGP